MRALRLVSDHVSPNWDVARHPTDAEVRATMAIAVPLAEASVKVRTGGPLDEPEDVDGPRWGGAVSIRATFGPPEPAPDLPAGIDVPATIAELQGRVLSA